jgi:hypothetical protein
VAGAELLYVIGEQAKNWRGYALRISDSFSGRCATQALTVSKDAELE